MKKAVVLLSGGLDSTTTLAIAQSEHYETFALSFRYGQRHDIELKMAQKNAELFNVSDHLTIDVNLRSIGGSALMTDMEMPERNSTGTDTKKEPDIGSEIPATYVPARNTIFLSFALSWAETLDAERIFIGVNALDYSGYPDCRPEYIKAFQDMANLATKASVEGRMRFKIHTPLISLTKAEIIKRGMVLGVDYALTWSCYDPKKEQVGNLEKSSASNNAGMHFVPCMQCESCLLRARGFEEAGVQDPLSRC